MPLETKFLRLRTPVNTRRGGRRGRRTEVLHDPVEGRWTLGLLVSCLSSRNAQVLGEFSAESALPSRDRRAGFWSNRQASTPANHRSGSQL
jgi:hypothetical protein